MPSALVLEGGAMRGLFTCGVTDVLQASGVSFDAILGVSAGAVFAGCNYKSHQPGRVLRYNLRFCKDPRFCSLRSWAKTGDLYGADFCYRDIPDRLDPFDRAAYAADPTDLYVVCTDADTGQPVYRLCPNGDDRDLTWMRASASMPLASRVVEIDGYSLLDGGISDSIPVRRALEMGYDRIVVILTRPLGYVKKKNPLLPVMRLALKRYPLLLASMSRRQDCYNEVLAFLRAEERAGRILVIRPEEALDIGKTEHNPEKIQGAYDHGTVVGEKRLASVLEYLNL